MRNNFFTSENEIFFNKVKKNTIVLLSIFGALFVISFVCFIVFASYEQKTLFQILGSICSSVFLCFAIAFIFKLKYVNDFIFRYQYIKEKEGYKIKGTFVESSKPITLQNNDKVKEIKILTDKSIKIYYLLNEIEVDFEVDKEYEFIIVDDYIKGVNYEL